MRAFTLRPRTHLQICSQESLRTLWHICSKSRCLQHTPAPTLCLLPIRSLPLVFLPLFLMSERFIFLQQRPMLLLHLLHHITRHHPRPLYYTNRPFSAFWHGLLHGIKKLLRSNLTIQDSCTGFEYANVVGPRIKLDPNDYIFAAWLLNWGASSLNQHWLTYYLLPSSHVICTPLLL